MVDISGIALARGIACDGRSLRIGTLETLEACHTSPLVRRHAPLLAEACAVIAAPGVRRLATLGGNIGWRQGDSIPALLVLDATIECADGIFPLADLLVRPRMPFMIAVHVPVAVTNAVFEKIGHRAAFSPSLITVAGRIERAGTGQISAARLAAGGAGLAARRLPIAEAKLVAADPDWNDVITTIAAELGGGARELIAGRVLAGRVRALA